MRIDPFVHSLPSLNPFSWEAALSRRATIEMEALPSGAASREKVLEILESLERQLVRAREHESFHPYSMRSVVDKTAYQCIATFPHKADVQTLRVSVDGVLAVGLGNGTIVVRHRGRYDDPIVLGGHKRPVVSLDFLPDGRFISGSLDGAVRVWTPDGQGVGYTSSQVRWCSFPLRALQALPGERVVLACEDGVVRLGGLHGIHYDILRPYDDARSPRSAVCSVQSMPDGRIIAGRDSGGISIWALGARGWSATGFRASGVSLITCLHALSPERVLVGGSDQGCISHFRVGEAWRSDVIRPVGAGWVTCVQVLPNDRVVFGTLRADIWIASLKERELSQLVGHAGKIMALQVTPEGVIFSCATDNTVRMWDGDRAVFSPSVGGAP
jgi:WD40 repeat protein